MKRCEIAGEARPLSFERAELSTMSRAYELSNMSRASIQPARYTESRENLMKAKEKRMVGLRLIQTRLPDRIKPIRLDPLESRIGFFVSRASPLPTYSSLSFKSTVSRNILLIYEYIPSRELSGKSYHVNNSCIYPQGKVFFSL